MTGLHDLPTETLILILKWLGIIDLQSLILSQRTSRQFQSVVQDILSSSTENRGWKRKSQWAEQPQIHPLWQCKFRGLLNSADCLTEKARRRMVYLTLDGDHTLPFRQLPWAQEETERSSYLRPEASWRALGVTLGHAPVTHLDLVKTYSASDGTRDTVDYCQVDVPGSGGLTMGMFYDLLLSEGVTYGANTGGWELLLGKRLRSCDVLLEYECFIADDEELVEVGEPSRQAAILYVSGGGGCNVKLEREVWIPRRIGKDPLTLFPWQGPKPYFVF